MNFLQRLTARALVSILPPTASPAIVQMLGGILPGAVGAPPARGSRELLEAYSTSPWLRAVVERIADGVAATQWRLYKPTAPAGQRAIRDAVVQRAAAPMRTKLIQARVEAGELREVTTHPLLTLLDTANTYHTGAQLRAVTQQNIELLGEGWWLKERNGFGVPVAVWPIPSSWILSTPTPAARTVRIAYRAFQATIPDTEFLWFCRLNPANPYGRGSGLGQTLADELESYEYATKFQKQKFYNQAKPDFIVHPKGEDAPGKPSSWNEPTRVRLEQEWIANHQGFWRAFRPMFASRELGVHEFKSEDFRALQMVQLREYERDVVLHVFGMPPELLGILQASNRSTIDKAKYHFDSLMLVPRLEFLRTTMQERLVPEYDERWVLDYVSPVQADAELALKAMEIAPWTASTDEWRRVQNLPPLDDVKGGKVHLVPSGYTAVDADGLTDIKPPVPVAPVARSDDEKAWMSEGGAVVVTAADIARLSTDELIALRGKVGG